jgi:hypothetical protein
MLISDSKTLEAQISFFSISIKNNYNEKIFTQKFLVINNLIMLGNRAGLTIRQTRQSAWGLREKMGPMKVIT